MSKVYFIEVSQVNGPKVAQAYGSLATIAYITRDAIKTMESAEAGADFAYSVKEVSEVGGSTEGARSIASVTADAEVVSLVARKRIATERKANGEDEGTEESTETVAEDTATEEAPKGRRRAMRGAEDPAATA